MTAITGTAEANNLVLRNAVFLATLRKEKPFGDCLIYGITPVEELLRDTFMCLCPKALETLGGIVGFPFY